ncbi:sugar-binding domain-containing protein [Pontibacter sp. G13]|uniref:glycoside hydrolase family 2 protein n=1 Tax=Pontibacter sp. G13 TaxID=3074898 RepID=UPI00288BE578|nr:sugar-binding domain-containing protein [Pontibacter sp. G13]WNJ19132.1 glycoside hydrolase family 2 TIM barrel-domain containing protein [Pontibacter sp. G13]
MRIYAFGLLAAILSVSLVSHAQEWELAEAPLYTPWADKVNPEQVLPEYPRPMMMRDAWLNLNGLWEFSPVEQGTPIRFGKKLDQHILVPYPWESALSGQRVQLDSRRARYRRTFELPAAWAEQDLLLHFGAVDWEASVYLNGQFVGQHRGGFDAFSLDITAFLKEKGPQELIVEVYDPGNDEAIAYGKQSNDRFSNPQRFSYTPASGIWQTVWLEPVADWHITDLHLVPHLDHTYLSVEIDMSHLSREKLIKVEISDSSQIIATSQGLAHQTLEIDLPNPRHWSPEDPFLYPVKITLTDSAGTVYDVVDSYFGMRKISIEPSRAGAQQLMLNNEVYFQMGPLDQGYWPDGIFTAPTDEALKWDIVKMKEFGFNMVRKHIKIEPQRWYYWCDKIGLLVWQDMPSTHKFRSEAMEIQFESELQSMIKTHWNHPSIVNWVVFNEHWGLYDPVRLTEFVMALDPSRLVTGNSGIDAGKPDVDFEVGHIKDDHSYRPPTVTFANDKRAVVCGEYGAIGYLPQDHTWDVDGPWVHYNYAGLEEATAEYERFVDMLIEFKREHLSAAVYTQWTDVENEMNGIYSYDRKVIKLDQARVTAANQSTYQEAPQDPER